MAFTSEDYFLLRLRLRGWACAIRTGARLEGGLYWAGATGRVFGHTGNYGQPNGVKTVVLEGSKVQQYGQHQSTWFVIPGPDDRHVYAGGHGVISNPVSNALRPSTDWNRNGKVT